MQPSIAKCPCGELFIMKRTDFEGFNLCLSCYCEMRQQIFEAENTWSPYRPSNGTEGFQFQTTFCDNCHYDGDPEHGKGCMILAKTMIYDIGDPEYPKEWVQNEQGEPRCTKFKSRGQWAKEHKPVPRVPKNQLKLL